METKIPAGSAPIDWLLEGGYEKDVLQRPLEADDQLVELLPQDIILPTQAGGYFLAVSRYVDELLVWLYSGEPYYDIRLPKDLVGHLVVGIAPQNEGLYSPV